MRVVVVFLSLFVLFIFPSSVLAESYYDVGANKPLKVSTPTLKVGDVVVLDYEKTSAYNYASITLNRVMVYYSGTERHTDTVVITDSHLAFSKNSLEINHTSIGNIARVYRVLLNGTPVYPDLTPPGELTSLSYSVLGDSVDFVWNNPVDLDFDKIQLFKDGNLYRVLVKTDKSFKDTGLLMGSTYSYVFKTVDVLGNVSHGVELKVVMPKPPAVPSNVSLTRGTVTSDEVALFFSAVDADKIDLFQNGDLIQSFSGDSRSYVVRSLVADTPYSFYILATNQYGSSKSNILDIRTLGPLPPVPPPEPLPQPPVPNPLPVPDVDTGNADFDEVTEGMLEGGSIMKNGGIFLIFWALAIAVVLFGARWLWSLFRKWMVGASGSSGAIDAPDSNSRKGRRYSKGSPGGSKKRYKFSKQDSSSRSGGSGSRDRATKTYVHEGKEYRVYEGSYDSRERINKTLSKFR